MKNTFPGYYADANHSLSSLWSNAIFVLDSSVLLNLFLLPEDLALKILNAIKKSKIDLWMPYVMASQYHMKIDDQLNKQIAYYQNIRKRLFSLEEVNKDFVDPILSEIEQKELSQFRTTIDNKIKDIIEKLKVNYIGTSVIRNRIADLYEGNIGTITQDPHPYSLNTHPSLEHTASEDECRAQFNSTKLSETDGSSYWTYEKIVLHSIMDRAKIKKKAIVYVLSSANEFYFSNRDDIYSGVRSDLQNYYTKYTGGQNLYCYVFHQFINELASDFKVSIPVSYYSYFEKKLSFHMENETAKEKWYQK